MIKLLEKELHLRCRKDDANLVKEIIPECEKEFQEIMLKETNEEYKTKLTLNESENLTPELGGECGGVLLYTTDKRIVCNNTLKSRLDLCFEELLPHIRSILFPAKKQ
jgi:V-type H+-transporting ATPase subunit E